MNRARLVLAGSLALCGAAAVSLLAVSAATAGTGNPHTAPTPVPTTSINVATPRPTGPATPVPTTPISAGQQPGNPQPHTSGVALPPDTSVLGPRPTDVPPGAKWTDQVPAGQPVPTSTDRVIASVAPTPVSTK